MLSKKTKYGIKALTYIARQEHGIKIKYFVALKY